MRIQVVAAKAIGLRCRLGLEFGVELVLSCYRPCKRIRKFATLTEVGLLLLVGLVHERLALRRGHLAPHLAQFLLHVSHLPHLFILFQLGWQHFD